MSTEIRLQPAVGYRNVPLEWEPIESIVCRYYPSRSGYFSNTRRCSITWLGVDHKRHNFINWGSIVGQSHWHRIGFTFDFPRSLADKSPWGMVSFSVHRDTSFVSSVQDIYGEALGMITAVFPKKYRANAAMIISAVVAAWSAGALTGLIMQSFAGIDALLAKKISGDIVGKVINPKVALKAVTAPPVPPKSNLSDLVKSLMAPIHGMSARSDKGNPIDGLGKTLAASVHKLGAATKSQDQTQAKAIAAAKAELQNAVAAVGQLQTNMAILVTLAFTNELRAAMIVPRNTMAVHFHKGWTPDQWFAWVQSLPRQVDAKTLPRPGLLVSRYSTTQADYQKCLKGAFFWGVNKQAYCRRYKPVPLPAGYDGVGPCIDCRVGGDTWMTSHPDPKSQALLANTVPPNKVNPAAVRRVQGAPTARRDCLRVYFRAAGIPPRLADWLQAAIDHSPEASAKARAGKSIVDVVLPAVRDAVKDATALHALPAALQTPNADPHRPGQLAPVLTGATLIAKGIATGVIAL